MTGKFADQVAFITGAAHGQGRATALALAEAGAQIVALDVARPLPYPRYALGTPDDLASLQASCAALGRECLTFAADVRDDAAVTHAVAEAHALRRETQQGSSPGNPSPGADHRRNRVPDGMT